MGYQVLLKKIHIKNFRSIVDETITLDDFNVFVGLNDCGKSNVLKALNLFFNGETEIGVPLDFPRDYSQHGKTGKGKAREIVVELELFVPENFSETGIKKWKKVWRDNELFYDNLTDIFKNYSKCVTLFKRIKFEYIPAVKSEDFFKELLLNLYNSMTHSADSALLKANSQYSKTLSELTQNLSRNVKDKIGIESTVKMPDKLSVLFKNLKIDTNDKYIRGIDLNHRGDGLKARHIPSILYTITENVKKARQKKSVDYTFIWGYEEPENGVEFFACSKLAEELYAYSSNIQMLLTTHSPAIYSKNTCKNAKCYYTYKNDNGDSKYEEDYDYIELNQNIGLMPLIAPHIEEFQKTLDERAKQIKYLTDEINKLSSITEKVIIYTEGKTDVDYLKTAFNEYSEYAPIAQRIEYYDIESAACTGDGELKKLFDYLQKGKDTNIKICMFDRDSEKMIINKKFEEAPNNVFRFNIPIPNHRNAEDKISIEHYFTDDDLNTVDSNGRKIFLAKEFDDKGMSLDGKYFYQYAKKHNDPKYNPLEIINGCESKRVFKNEPNNMDNFAMTKDDLAKHVMNKDDNFKFDLNSFKLILDVIQEIIICSDNKNK